MAYMVSQLKKSDYGQTNAFMKTVRVTPKIVHTPSPYENLEDEVQGMLATQFDDLGFETTSQDPFDKNTTYFFRCGIRQIYSDYPSSQIWKQETEQKTLNISVTLREDSESTQDIEVIDTFIIPPAVTKDVNYYTYSVVFTPVQTCRTLVLKLNRKANIQI